MSKPRLLDLFSGTGGCARGYQMAGFHVTGVDIRPQPRYAGDVFIQGDALDYCREHGHEFDVIHASPPCQFFTQMRASWRARGVNDGYQDLLTPTLEWLRASGQVFVVENVVGAKRAMRDPVTLHGGMFGLEVHRPRLFESNVFILVTPAPIRKQPIGVYDSRPRGTTHHRTRLNGNGNGRSEMRIARTLEEGQRAMGIDWMEWSELKESIPPAYTEFIGRQLIAAMALREAA